MATDTATVKTENPKLFDPVSLGFSILSQFSNLFKPQVKQEDQSYQEQGAKKLLALAGEKATRETAAELARRRMLAHIQTAKADALGLNNLVGASANFNGNIGGAANVGAVLNKATPLKAQISAQLSGQETGAEQFLQSASDSIHGSTAQDTGGSMIEKRYNMQEPQLSINKTASDANLLYEGFKGDPDKLKVTPPNESQPLSEIPDYLKANQPVPELPTGLTQSPGYTEPIKFLPEPVNTPVKTDPYANVKPENRAEFENIYNLYIEAQKRGWNIPKEMKDRIEELMSGNSLPKGE